MLDKTVILLRSLFLLSLIFEVVFVACFHPLKGFAIGNTVSGKVSYKITSYLVDHVERQNGVWIPVQYHDRGSAADSVVRDFITVPCGQCVGCRLEYSRQWANRCMLELQYHDSAYFVTLTYDDEHLPVHWYSDPDTGEAFESYSLEKRDFQLFMKRLRKRFSDDKLRYFASGEYGSKTYRPHYHAIIFGLHLDDLVVYKRSFDNKFVYYNSDSFSSCWQKGYAVVANVSWETCAYTARYVMKKLKGEEAVFYDLHNIEPEFTLMSRKPGIAAQYFIDHPDIYDYEFINISTDTGGKKFRPPRYYDRLFDVEHPDEMAHIKEVRKRLAEDAVRLKLEKTSLSYLEMLAVEESNLKSRIKSLERRLE